MLKLSLLTRCRPVLQSGYAAGWLDRKKSSQELCGEQDANCDGQDGFFFDTPELTSAGAWTLTAEYTETRPELVKALAKRDTCLRSSAIKLNV
jgi:hypothetical protein